MSLNRITLIIKRFQQLKAERGVLEEHLEDVAEFVYPQREAFVSEPVPGEKFFERVFDSTAIVANERLASALHGMLTNPASKWFKLRIANKALNDDDSVKKWLGDVEDKMTTAINSPRANFANAMHELYMEYGAFGTAILFIGLDRDKSGLLFQARPLSEMVLAENSENKVDTFFRKFKFTLAQAEDQFPGKLTEENKKKLAIRPDEKIEILHMVAPRTSRSSKSKRVEDLPVEEVYIDIASKVFLLESGYEESPFMAPRFWKTSRETYGRSPGMHALPFIKTLNVVSETDIKARQLNIAPPMTSESDNVLSQIRMTPFGVTNIETGTTPLKPLIVGSNIAVSNDMIERTREEILKIFFADQVQLSERANMTATEVLQRTEDKLRLLGPVLGRTQTEFLGPMIDRVFGIMRRGGAFLPPPEILGGGANIQVEYVSPIALAQKQLEAQSLLRMIDIMTPFININPALMDNINGDKSMREVGHNLGVPADFFNSKEEVDGGRQARAAAEQRVQDSALRKEQAETGKTITEAAQNV